MVSVPYLGTMKEDTYPCAAWPCPAFTVPRGKFSHRPKHGPGTWLYAHTHTYKATVMTEGWDFPPVPARDTWWGSAYSQLSPGNHMDQTGSGQKWDGSRGGC